MSIHLKLILPFIDKSLKLEDISPKTGFINSYTMDINRPSLTNHIFLLYERLLTDESLKTREKLSNLPNLYSKRNIKINGVLCVVFCFTIVDYTIKLIKRNGYLLLNKDNKLHIGNFWQYTDAEVTEFLLGYMYLGKKFKDSYVPEEDFSPKDFITYDEKRGTLVMSASL